MNMIKLASILLIAAALAACATGTGNVAPTPHAWAKEAQTADSRDAHLRLAAHYDEVAKNMEANALEEQEILAEYLARPWKYGKKIQDMQAQASAMIRDLQASAAESRKLAEYHRQIAAELP